MYSWFVQLLIQTGSIRCLHFYVFYITFNLEHSSTPPFFLVEETWSVVPRVSHILDVMHCFLMVSFTFFLYAL